jgi:acyl-CoA thioesterase-1
MIKHAIGNFTMKPGFCALIALLMFSWATTRAADPNPTPTVINNGRCGQNSGIVRDKFTADVLALRPPPDYVLIYIGMNDVINDRFFTPLDQYIENVRWMIQQSRAAGITPVVCTIHHCIEAEVYKHHPREKFGEETVNGKMDRYNAALKRLVAEEKADLADFNAVTDRTPQSEFLSKDGVHLTASGNKLLAKTFFDVIEPRLRGGEVIACCGDSLTYGYQNLGAGGVEGETYPAILRMLLTGSPPGQPR